MPDESCHKLTLNLPRDSAHALATAFEELFWPTPDAVGLFDNEDGTWRVEATFLEVPDRSDLRSFISGHTGDPGDYKLEEIPQEDWVSISQQGLHPVRAGRFLVHGSHDRNLPATRNRWAIEIDAGEAFGTAHHGSTIGCLHALDTLAKSERFEHILDLGTGTGVLAIAASRCWQSRIIASDIDPVAVSVAERNIRENGAGASIRAITASGLDHAAIRALTPYDLVIANILARPLVKMAGKLSRALRPGGILVLSGITKDQAGRVSAAFATAGFTRHRRLYVGEWVTITLRRGNRA